jgi:hypothetical protein
MPGSDKDDDDNDDEQFPLSQSDRDIYTWIQRKCGSLPRDDFKKYMSQFAVGDLSIYRSGLYMVCKEDVPNTPLGELVIRSNGSTDTQTLCEDIYITYINMWKATRRSISKRCSQKSHADIASQHPDPW